MSYILDALRRAERERTLGQVPGSETLSVATVQPPGRDRRLLIVLASATAVLAAAVAITMVVDRTRRTTPAPTQLPQPRSGQAVSAGTASAPESAGVTAAPDEAVPVFEDDAALASLDDIAAPFAARPAVASAPVLLPAEPSAVDADTLGADVAGQAPESLSSPAVTSAYAEEATSVPPSHTIESASLPKAPPLLRDMPPAFRARFPALTLQVHVYDKAPEKRWVMIDNRRYRESGVLENGPTIVEITPDGVIFELQGEQVLWPLVR